jgi:hypothetical protein
MAFSGRERICDREFFLRALLQEYTLYLSHGGFFPRVFPPCRGWMRPVQCYPDNYPALARRNFTVNLISLRAVDSFRVSAEGPSL